MNIIIFIIILLVLVLIHESGHFFTAKGFGIRVDEFGFGFPPKLFGIKRGETEYTINALPFGGFVKIFGENPDEESIDGPDAKRSFVNQAKYKQAIVLVAGVVSNFLLAWLLFSIGFMAGLPASVGAIPDAKISDAHLVAVSILSNSPAEKAGLKPGDKILSVASGADKISDPNPISLKAFVVAHGEKEMQMVYMRGRSVTQTVAITPTLGSGTQPSIGIAMDEIGTLKLPFWQSLYEGMKFDLHSVKSIFLGLFGLIWGGVRGSADLSGVTGPVGIVGIVGDAYQMGWAYLLSFTALISVNLAVINLLPFPALDGGRLFFLLIEKIKGSRINPKVANTLNMIGFGILIILMLLVTYHDVVKLL